MTILMGMSVLLLLLFVMAEAATYHLQFATGLDARIDAKNLAESAVNEALAAALGDDNYGKSPIAVVVPGDGDPTRNYGVVSFGSADSRAPNSLNNLNNLNQIPGSTGHAVPPNTLHIVGKGRVGDVEQTVETIFYRPPFPKALSASGPIRAVGTVVLGMNQNAVYPSSGDPNAIPQRDRLPGCVQTNSRDNGRVKAIDLLQCAISGDAAAVGSVQVDSATTVQGEVRQGGTPQTIPHIDVSRRINDIRNASGTQMLSGVVSGQTISWFSGSTDPVLTVNGDLDLKNGVLWTTGDLIVNGGIKGQGLILCEGKLEVHGGTSLRADNLIAAAVVKDVLLQGQDANRNNYFFQGIVYTQGNFRSQDLTVIGSVIADSSDPTKGRMDLNNVNVVQTPQSASVCQGGMMQVWSTQCQGKTGPRRPGSGIKASPVTNPPAPASYDSRPGAVVCVDPRATRSNIYFTMSPTAASILNNTATDQTQYNFTLYNSARPIGGTGITANPTTQLTIYGKNDYGTPKRTRDMDENGTTVETTPRHILKRTAIAQNWFLPLPALRRFFGGGAQDIDVIPQVGIEAERTISDQLSTMLFPPVNSLFTPGERSRILLWRNY